MFCFHLYRNAHKLCTGEFNISVLFVFRALQLLSIITFKNPRWHQWTHCPSSPHRLDCKLSISRMGRMYRLWCTVRYSKAYSIWKFAGDRKMLDPTSQHFKHHLPLHVLFKSAQLAMVRCERCCVSSLIFGNSIAIVNWWLVSASFTIVYWIGNVINILVSIYCHRDSNC